MKGILGRKIGMTQIFSDAGEAVPVTVVQAGPCLVVQRKTADRDGYDAVQIGLVEERPPRRVSQPMRGHFERAEVAPMRRLAEFAIAAGDEMKAGDQIKASIFAVDVIVDREDRPKAQSRTELAGPWADSISLTKPPDFNRQEPRANAAGRSR